MLLALNCDSSDERLQGFIDEGIETHLIQEVPGTVTQYQFTHALIQETLAQELTGYRRATLHARIGEVLEQLYGATAEDHASELAQHYSEASEVLGLEKAVDYRLLAGEQALAAYAWEEALEHFQRGLNAKKTPLTGTEPASDSKSAALLFGLGRAQVVTLPREKANTGLLSLERSFDYYASAGDVTNAVAVGEYPIPRGFQERTRVEKRVEQALRLAPTDSIAAGHILATYGTELSRFENDYAKAQAAFEHALAIARRTRDVGLQMRTLAAWAQVDYFHLHLAECVETSLRVIDLARHANDLHLEMDGHLNALQALIHLGDSGLAKVHALAGLALAEQLRSRRWLASILRCCANLYRFLGEWDHSKELSWRILSGESNEVPALKELVSLEYELGEVEQGDLHLNQMHEVMQRIPPRPGAEYADTSLVSHFASGITGCTGYLEAAGQAAQMVLSSPLARPFWIEIVRTGLALRAVQTGDSDLAQEQYLALAGLPGKMRGSYISADRLLGLLAKTMGNLEQAVEHFEDALDFCRRQGFRPELAWTGHDYADALLQFKMVPQWKQAVSLLDESLIISTALGMRPLMERVTRLRHSVETTPVLTAKNPANMTPRQMEVLRLLAQGMTNREIALALLLSERTMQRHIADIYDKIGARNRSEATAFAVSQLNTVT